MEAKKQRFSSEGIVRASPELYDFLEQRKLFESFIQVVDDHSVAEGEAFVSLCQQSIRMSRVQVIIENLPHLYAAMKSMKRSVFSSFEFLLQSDESAWRNYFSEGRLTTKGLMDLNEFMLQRSIRAVLGVEEGIESLSESLMALRGNPPALHDMVWHELADYFIKNADKVVQTRKNLSLLASFTKLEFKQKHSAKLFSALVRANLIASQAEATVSLIRNLNLKTSLYLTEYIECTEVEIGEKLLRRLIFESQLNCEPIEARTTKFDENYLRIPSKFLQGCGLYKDGDLLVFQRPIFLQEWKYLEEQILAKGKVGSIVGPPGVGKSITALAFASQLNREIWNITWIHLRRDSIDFVRFSSSKNFYGSIEFSQLKDALYVENDHKHILFLDGYSQERNHQGWLGTCESWFESDRANHRFVTISSMSARTGNTDAHDKRLGLVTFQTDSWTLADYVDAIKSDTFFDSIKENLCTDKAAIGSVCISQEQRQNLIRSKYYFAGGSARFMFDFETEEVICALERAISEAKNVEDFFNNFVGDMSKVNRLFGSYSEGTRKKHLISAFAATQIAAIVGPDAILNMRKNLQIESNPAMDGWLFEMWFFSMLTNCGISFTKEHSQRMSWEPSPCMTFDPSAPPALKETIWLKPKAWNQGGYDAVRYLENKTIQFFQICKANQNTLKLRFFAQLLRKFQEALVDIESVEIFFVTPTNNTGLVISQVTERGSLSKFGWKKGSEEENIQILFVEAFSKSDSGYSKYTQALRYSGVLL